MHGGNLTLNELTKFTNNIKSQKSRFHANPDFRHSVDHRRTPSIASSALTNNFQLQWVINCNLLTTTIVAPPSNASKWQMGFNSAFKGLT